MKRMAMARRWLSTVLAIATLSGCGGIAEPEVYAISVVNDSDSAFLASRTGSPFIVPPHSIIRVGFGNKGAPNPLTIYRTDCTTVRTLELSPDNPQVYIHEGGDPGLRTAAEASLAPKPQGEAGASDGDYPFSCQAPGWGVFLRNDSSGEVLIQVGFSPPRWLSMKEDSRAALLGGPAGSAFPADLSVRFYRSDCTRIGSVSLAPAMDVLFVNSAGQLSTQGREAFWAGMTAAQLKVTTRLPDATCPDN